MKRELLQLLSVFHSTHAEAEYLQWPATSSGSVASTIDGHGFHILRADNSLVVHFNFQTGEKAKIAHERLAGMISDVQSMTVYTPDPHSR